LQEPRGQQRTSADAPGLAPPEAKVLQVRHVDGVLDIRLCPVEHLVDESEMSLDRFSVLGIDGGLCGMGKCRHLQVEQTLRTVIDAGSHFREPFG
jgi:hypothetical protein